MMRVLLTAVNVFACRCVLELHAIAAKKVEGEGEFAVGMTADERQRFLQGIRGDPSEYYNMLGTVNAERSECSRLEDRVSIHDGIRGSVGFAQLSRMVFGVMEEWMEGQLRGQAVACRGAGDEMEAMNWTAILLNILSDQGRHLEALAMNESVLEFRRRVLPADDPSIGEGHVCGAAACACVDCDAMACRLTCRPGHGQPCVDVLCPGPALGCACDEGKCAGVQASRAACGPSFHR